MSWLRSLASLPFLSPDDAPGNTPELDAFGDPTSPQPENLKTDTDDDEPLIAPDEPETTITETPEEPVVDTAIVEPEAKVAPVADEFVETTDEYGEKIRVDKRAASYLDYLRKQNETLRQSQTVQRQPVAEPKVEQVTEPGDLTAEEIRAGLKASLDLKREMDEARETHRQNQVFTSRTQTAESTLKQWVQSDPFLSANPKMAERAIKHVNDQIQQHRSNAITLDEKSFVVAIKNDFDGARKQLKEIHDDLRAEEAARQTELAKARASSAKQGQPQPTGVRKGPSTTQQAEADDWINSNKGFNKARKGVSRLVDALENE